MRDRLSTSAVISRILVAVVGLIFIFPFIWMVATSLKPSNEVFSTGTSLLASTVEWGNYVTAFTAVPFMRYLVNGLIIATLGAALTAGVGVLSAYAFARLRFRFRDQLFLLFLGTLVLPQEVLVIPLYMMFRSAGLVDSYVALVLPFAFGAFSAFLLRQFIMGIPSEYEEAAKVDGAGSFQTFVRVILPLLKAPMSVVAVFAFVDYWNMFLWPLIIVNDTTMANVPLGLAMFSGERGTDWGPLMAASTLAVVPSVIIVVALQKQLVQGINMSGFGGR
ncbi:carbohydrate ABC transporter permease [Tessaracoccus sp. G1721]